MNTYTALACFTGSIQEGQMYIFFYLYGEPLWECESLVGWDNANEYLPEIDPDIFTQLGMNTCCSFMKWMVVLFLLKT